jgi:hypothetical protein
MVAMTNGTITRSTCGSVRCVRAFRCVTY